jgi:hypothetical protein
MRSRFLPIVAGALFISAAFNATDSTAQGMLENKKGQGGSEIQGAAGTQGAQNAAGDLERCDKPMGAVAVVEPQDFIVQSLSQYGLSSPVGLIRMMIQQSNCFLVVERGVGMQNLMQERALAGGGQTRGGSNMGGGQMVVADFVLTPSVVFSEKNAGGMGAALGGLFGGAGAVLGAVVGSMKFKEAQTSMLVADARSGLQVAAAEGSTKKADLNLGGLLLGGGAGAAMGGYSNTNEGKIIAASFLDNYNNIVRVVRNDPNLQRAVGSLAQEAAAGGSTKAGAVFAEGDVLIPKIASIKLLRAPSDSAPTIATLGKSDEMIYMAEEKAGFVKVESGKGAGWVKKILVTR